MGAGLRKAEMGKESTWAPGLETRSWRVCELDLGLLSSAPSCPELCNGTEELPLPDTQMGFQGAGISEVLLCPRLADSQGISHSLLPLVNFLWSCACPVKSGLLPSKCNKQAHPSTTLTLWNLPGTQSPGMIRGGIPSFLLTFFSFFPRYS